MTASNFRKAIRSYRRLLEYVAARDDVGAQKHWRTHMEVAARALLPDELRSATVLDLFS